MRLVKDINWYETEKRLNGPNFSKMDHTCLRRYMALLVGQQPINYETKYRYRVVEGICIYPSPGGVFDIF